MINFGDNKNQSIMDKNARDDFDIIEFETHGKTLGAFNLRFEHFQDPESGYEYNDKNIDELVHFYAVVRYKTDE